MCANSRPDTSLALGFILHYSASAISRSRDVSLLLLLLLTTCWTSFLLCSGAEGPVVNKNFQRFTLQNGIEGKYIGMFSNDAKFRKSSKFSRFLDRNATGPSLVERHSVVPAGMLHSYARVVEDFQPPAHAVALPETHSLAGVVVDDIVNFAYGHSRVLIAPQRVTSDSRQRVIVSDPGVPAVHVLDPTRKTSFSILGGQGHRLQQPSAVAVDGGDNIYIADSSLGMVLVYDQYGRFLHYIGQFHGENMYQRPTGIAIDRKAGRLYLADGPRHLIFMLDLLGNELTRVGKKREKSREGGLKIRHDMGPGDFSDPTDIAVGDHEVVVLDSNGTRVRIMDLACNLIGGFSIVRAAGEQAGGVGTDKKGDIYVSYVTTSEIKVYSHDGNVLGSFGRPGFRMGEFYSPTGLWIDAAEQIHVVDTENARVQLFQLTPPAALSVATVVH